MGRVALVESLRGTAAADAEALWRDTRAAAEAYRAELAQALEHQSALDAQAAATHALHLESEAIVEAGRRAGEVRAQAALVLADRLYALARAELRALRATGGQPLFVALAGELPARDWQRVRVHPGDEALAREAFPHATIDCDADIQGGLVADAEEGRIRISNTLETRLENAWPDVLPHLIEDLLAGSHDHRTAA
ncbi:MAG TPA: V-type ATP synthase subunit E family protein [Steroidobacteraceae bacterium]